MFEHFFNKEPAHQTYEKGKPVEGDRGGFEHLRARERAIIEKAEKAIDGLTPEKMNKKAAWLLALSLFVGATSAAAEEKHDIDAKQSLPSFEQNEKTAKNNVYGIAPFDWQNVVNKLEVSVVGKSKYEPQGTPEVVHEFNDRSKFYQGMTDREAYDVYRKKDTILTFDSTTSGFFDRVAEFGTHSKSTEKVLFLQNLGNDLLSTYNFDMLKSNEHIKISDDAMLRAERKLVMAGEMVPTGMCGNIHAFLARTATHMGIDAWLQTATSTLGRDGKQGNHIFMGMLVGEGDKKQIAFLDYGTLIPAGTLDYKRSRGIAERYLGSVGTFNYFVSGADASVLFPVKSFADEVVERSAGIDDTSKRLEGEVAQGYIKSAESGIKIRISPEEQNIAITGNHLAIAYTEFKDTHNDPYMSLKGMSAVRVGANVKGEHFGIEADATTVHLDVKDMYGGSNERDEIFARLAMDYVDSHDFTKADYGQFRATWGATVQAATMAPQGQSIDVRSSSAMAEGTVGGRMIYLDPRTPNKYYVGISEAYRFQNDNVEEQNIILKKAGETLTLGSEVRVNEIEVLKLEAQSGAMDWGKKDSVKGVLEGSNWKGEVQYEQARSSYERFIPSAEKVTLGVGYKKGNWEVDVIGSRTNEQYKNAEKNIANTAEVKMKILF